jgi:hypothetical protein
MKVYRELKADEPVTVEEVKRFLRVDYTDDDVMLEGMIRASREQLERRLNISIPLQEVEVYWPEYAPTDIVPYGPVVEWDDLTIDGVDQTPPNDDTFRLDKGALYATYTAGHDEVPDELKRAIMKLVKVDYDGEGDTEKIINSVSHYSRLSWF